MMPMQSMKQFFNQFIEEFYKSRSALLYDADVNNPFSVQTFSVDLTSARDQSNPLKIGVPFKSIACNQGIGVNANCDIYFNTLDSASVPVNFKDNSSLETGAMFKSAYILNTAQPGKSLTILVFTNSIFRTGAFLNSGTVNVAQPSTLTGPSSITLTAATAAAVAPVLTTRLKTTLQNQTGNDIWIGGSTVTDETVPATQGILIPNLGIFEHTSSAALYAYSKAGGLVNRIDEA